MKTLTDLNLGRDSNDFHTLDPKVMKNYATSDNITKHSSNSLLHNKVSSDNIQYQMILCCLILSSYTFLRYY